MGPCTLIRFTISSWNLTWLKTKRLKTLDNHLGFYIFAHAHTLVKSWGLKFTMTHLHAWPVIAKVPNSLTHSPLYIDCLQFRYMISIVPITHESCLLSCMCKNDLVWAFVLVYYFGYIVPMNDVWNKIIHKKV
jgi:hypothetical protein